MRMRPTSRGPRAQAPPRPPRSSTWTSCGGSTRASAAVADLLHRPPSVIGPSNPHVGGRYRLVVGRSLDDFLRPPPFARRGVEEKLAGDLEPERSSIPLLGAA